MNRESIIPKVYKEMESLNYTKANNKEYLWLYDMEWLEIDEILNYEYEEGESSEIIPFAHTGGGDKWVWILDNNVELPVGLCYHDDSEGIYYAKNLQDALFRQIIDFVSGSNFYIQDESAESYQMNIYNLRRHLNEWKTKLGKFFTKEKNEVIESLLKKELKLCRSKYGDWYALLTEEESNEIVNKFIDFELIDETFEWIK